MVTTRTTLPVSCRIDDAGSLERVESNAVEADIGDRNLLRGFHFVKLVSSR
jgi:hypothetical protein